RTGDSRSERSSPRDKRYPYDFAIGWWRGERFKFELPATCCQTVKTAAGKAVASASSRLSAELFGLKKHGQVRCQTRYACAYAGSRQVSPAPPCRPCEHRLPARRTKANFQGS